jgi:hypothetical protein
MAPNVRNQTPDCPFKVMILATIFCSFFVEKNIMDGMLPCVFDATSEQ